MKKLNFALILALLFAFVIQNSQSQWVSQNIPGNLFFLNGIDFYNSQTGAVGGWVGTFSPTGFSSGGFSTLGRALYTTNGGTNWNYANIPDSLRVMIAVQYIDQQNVYGFGVKNITPAITGSKILKDFEKSRFTASLNSRTNMILSDDYSKGRQEGSGETRGYFQRSTHSGPK